MNRKLKRFPFYVTSQDLEERQACPSQVQGFETEWPNRGWVTLKALYRANELGLDIGWIVEDSITKSEFLLFDAEYKPALDRHTKQEERLSRKGLSLLEHARLERALDLQEERAWCRHIHKKIMELKKEARGKL